VPEFTKRIKKCLQAIRRAADGLEAAIKGKPLTNVWFAFTQLKPFESQLVGQTVTH
jgi:endonuclease VIII